MDMRRSSLVATAKPGNGWGNKPEKSPTAPSCSRVSFGGYCIHAFQDSFQKLLHRKILVCLPGVGVLTIDVLGNIGNWVR